MPTLRKIHLTNAAGRDATVNFSGLKPATAPRLGLPGKQMQFQRYLATTDTGLHESLVERFEPDYAQALIDGDPEVDVEQVGRRIGRTDTVYLSGTGTVMYAPPSTVEVILGADGAERERRTPEDVEANVNDETRALRWTGRKMPLDQLVRRFSFKRTIQLQHVDGLSYDYLHGMADMLATENVAVMIGAGAGGKQPLIFQLNGSPYRGFLTGRVEGAKYMLLLHLSNMELKLPAEA